jgi:cellulose synthase/poly-beta-1,6-N-acetylglucosamine synthase-like glycosyltransferase
MIERGIPPPAAPLCDYCTAFVSAAGTPCQGCWAPQRGLVKLKVATGRRREVSPLGRQSTQTAPQQSAPAPRAQPARRGGRILPSATNDAPVERMAACCGCGRAIPTVVRFCRYCGTRRDWTPWQISPRPMLPKLAPELSAERTGRGSLIRWATASLIGAMALAAPMAMANVAIAVITALYIAAFTFRIWIFKRALGAPDVIEVADDVARSIPERDLPIYTILVPAYREPEVIGSLLAAIEAIDYPRHLLDVKLLLETDDPETYWAILRAKPAPYVDVIRVRPIGPKTKPKACNIGLAQAKGEYVTIYDAEDWPEPLQLRRVVAAFRSAPPRVACLQAKLSYRNPDQNLITRWFTIEYAMWFQQFLPGLVSLGAPVPLGGTSNHFRRPILEALGAWDPHNVTEDADLGIRLHRAGYRTGVLESTTLEEANSDFVNWVKQRSRWYKGYLQTWLVHMRDPQRLWHELGARSFLGFQLFVAGTPLLALLNPVFWGLTAVWFLAAPNVIETLFPAWLYYPSLLCLVVGNFLFLYTSMISARMTGRPGLVFAAALMPIYWVMMSIAAIKAAVQLINAPSFWEKTAHGLDAPPTPEPAP